MKKILILLIFVLSFMISFSQPVVNRSSDVITVQDGNLFAKNSFRPAVYLDTASANLVVSLDSCGKMIFTYSGNSYWQRSCNPKRWVRILNSTDNITADNGLTKNTGTNVQLGGTLSQTTTLDLNGTSDLVISAPFINSINHYFKADGSIAFGVGSNPKIGINNFTPTVELDARGKALLRNTTSTFEFTGWPSSYGASFNNPVVGVFGLEPSLDILIDSNSSLLRGGITFRTLKSSAPKLPSATFGANAGAKIEYNSFINGSFWTSTMEFYIPDTSNNTIHVFALSGPGTHFYGNRIVFTAESKEALMFGTAIRGVNSAAISGLSDTSYFVGDAGNKNMYIFNIPNIASDTTNYKPMVYNPTTGVWARSTWPATGGGSGGSGISEVIGAFGLVNINDSTLRADTTRVTGLPSYFYVDSLFSTGGGGVVNTRYSITKGTGDSLQLVNDALAPGFNMFYGANSDSTKGYHKMQQDTGYITKHIVQDTSGANSSARSTAGSAVQYPDGHIVLAYSFYFGAAIGDQDSAKVAIKRSYDGGSTWKNISFLNAPSGKKSIYVPSLMLIGDTLFMMTSVVNPAATSADFWLFKSVDGGYTWDAGTQMAWTAGFHTHGANRFHRSRKSSRIFYPWQINTNGTFSSSAGNYYGKLSYSDDEMVSWVQSSLTIQPEDSICIEGGIYETNDSLIYYWRNRSGYILYIASGDDGNNWTIPSTININTANLGIQNPNSHSDIKRIENDNLYVVAHNPVYDGFINNSANGRFRVELMVSYSGRPNSFFPAQQIEYDTTGGRSYGDITINPLIDNILIAYYVANRASTAYQYRATIFDMDKMAYMGSIMDSITNLFVSKKLTFQDTVIARFAPKYIIPAGIASSTFGGIYLQNAPVNGVQNFGVTTPEILGRSYLRNSGLTLTGETYTNGGISPTSNFDGGIIFNARSRSGALSNFDLARFLNNGGSPYLRMIPNGTSARVWFEQTALFGSTTIFDATAEAQVRDDVSYSIFSIYNNTDANLYGRLDFNKNRVSANPNTNDYIGRITFNGLNNSFGALANGLTNSVTGGKPIDFVWNTTNAANSSAEGMRFTSERLLGVGTQVPLDRLHVSGTARVTDTLKLPNIATKIFDTTNYKLTVVDASGNVFKMAWPVFGGGGSVDTTETKLPIYVIAGTKDTLALRFGFGLTTAAADTALIVDSTRGTGIPSYFYVDSLFATAGGGGTPGGANTNVQYNDGGVFGGEAAFVYDETNNSIYVDSARTLRLQSPLILGGTATTSSIAYKTTTGVGTTGANHTFLVGNNGADTALIMLNNKNIGFGFSTPTYKLDLRNTTGVNLHMGNNFNDEGLYMSVSTGLFYYGWNSAYNGATHTAKATTSTLWAQFGSSQAWYANSGLTIGNTYTPTERMRLTTTGLGIGINTPANLLHVESAGALSTTVIFPAKLSHVTSSTASTGFGVGMQTALENASGTTVTVGNLTWLFTDATAASEDADLTVNLMAGGAAAAEKFRVTSTGVARFNNAFSFPSADGSSGQVLQTNGSGTVSWAAPTNIYTSNGTISSARTVTSASLAQITFDGFPYFNIKSGSLRFQNSGTQEYNISSGTGFPLNIGWTHAGAFDDGISIQIDTNNNAAIGVSAPVTTSPLFAAGTSLWVGNGLLSAAGNFYKVRAVTTTGDILITDYFITVDATGGAVTLTLPAASTAFGNNVGIQYVIKRLDNSVNLITIQRAGSDVIDGGTSTTLVTQYEVKELQCSSTSTWSIK